MSIFWITFNFVDFRSKIIVNFVDVNYKNVILINATNDFNRITTTMNSVIVVQFFDFIYKSVFEYLLIVNPSNDDFFHSMFTYFNIVKMNNRDMLHLHCFLWFREICYITNFRNRVFTNLDYDIKMIRFIDWIIKCLIVSIVENFVSIFDTLSTNLNKSLKEFIRKLHDDNNVAIFKTQMYLFLHNVTFFKYSAVFINKCWFDFFRVCRKRFTVTKHDNIELYKNKIWINF